MRLNFSTIFTLSQKRIFTKLVLIYELTDCKHVHFQSVLFLRLIVRIFRQSLQNSFCIIYTQLKENVFYFFCQFTFDTLSMKDVCWHTDTAKNLSLFDERELFVLFSKK